MSYRIGFGVDFHRLAEGREFWLGGVRLEHNKGAEGHSDADVLLHAICDALLGAAGLGDIGFHFPDSDPAYKDIASSTLLQRTVRLIRDRYEPVNIDCTVCLEAPRIRPYVGRMQEVIADILDMGIEDISIKATTTEKMDAVGKEEGVIAYATVLLREKS
ncbi:MAG TPA: 2-C-methyl-D-erythritol 2,4-cyclodiphosphate synthase [Chitinophagaceae bacterium]|nr:2-C-methyl-D-erythritol 2,4-cyclodiphosphate synthase [Chitinophagaceae bacterium]